MSSSSSNPPEQDLKKMFQQLTVERTEPDQIEDNPVVPQEIADENIKKIQIMQDKFNSVIAAGETLQEVLDAKLKHREVKIDPNKDSQVLQAIRNVFGKNTTVITYDMFKKCLQLKSELTKG